MSQSNIRLNPSYAIRETQVFSLFRLMRISHWVKNVFLLVPAVFAGLQFSLSNTMSLALAFVCFSMVASAVYILNDWIDVDKDRNHPTKRNRPIASGEIGKRTALVWMTSLLLIAGILSIAISSTFFAVCSLYFAINVLYSFYTKHIVGLDMVNVAAGFVLRVVAGGVVSGVPVSNWLIGMTFTLALLLTIGKRRGELIAQTGKNTRAVLSGYRLVYLNAALLVTSVATIVAYTLYTTSEQVVERLGGSIWLTTVLVAVGILRYLQQAIVFNRAEWPTRLLYRDRVLQTILLVWASAFVTIIYQS